MNKYVLKTKKDIDSYFKYLCKKSNEKIEKAAVNLLLEENNYIQILRFLNAYDVLRLSSKNIQKLLEKLINIIDKNNLYLLINLLNIDYYQNGYSSIIIDKIIKDGSINDLYKMFKILKEKGNIFYNEIVFIDSIKNKGLKDSKDKYNIILELVEDNILSNEAILQILALLSISQIYIIYFTCDLYEKIPINYIIKILKAKNANEVEYSLFINNEKLNKKSNVYENSIDIILDDLLNKNIENYSSLATIYINSKEHDEEKSDILFDMIINSLDDYAILKLIENASLTINQKNKILDVIEENNMYKLAYWILINRKNDDIKKKRLINVIIKSTNKKYIALTALFIDNSLIEKIFSDITGLYIYLNNLNLVSLEDCMDFDKEKITKEYLNIIEEETDAKELIKKIDNNILLNAMKRKNKKKK